MVAFVGLAVPATIMGHREIRGVRGVKTAVTALLLIAVVIRLLSAGGGVTGGAFALSGGAVFLIVIGLALTVVADWLLAPIDNSRTFVWGLAFFLGGYLLYGVAFLVAAPATGSPLTPGLLAVVYLPVAAAGVAQYKTLRTLPEGLRIPVIAYMVVASNLLVAGVLYAVVRYAGAVPFSGGAGPVAATLTRASLVLVAVAMIYLSDSLIAHNLFRRPLKRPQLWIMPTYYVGQIAVVLALIL